MAGVSAGPISAPTAPGIPGAAPVTALPNNGGAAPKASGGPPAQTAQQAQNAFNAAGLNAKQEGQVLAGQPSGTPALLVSSSASRANTTSNVNSYNSAVTSMSTPSATTPVTPSITNPTPNGTQTPATGNGGTPASTGGASSNPGGGTTSAPSTANPGSNNSGAGITAVTFSDGSSGQYNQSTGQMTDMNGNALSWNGTGWVNPLSPGTPMTATGNGPAVQGASSAPASSTPSAGSYGATPAGQNAYSAAVGSGMPTSMAQSYADNIDALSQEETQAKATLAQAAATVANDPVATAAIAAISAKYDTLINAMTAKNTQVLGRASTNVAAFGGLGIMSQSFMSNEMDAASSRIADLNSQRNSAMLAAGTAYAKQDLAAFNTAQTAADKALTDMNTALNDLNTATDKQVTQTQNATKIAAAASKQQQAADIANSTKLAAGIVQELQSAGITDASGISQEDIQGLAEEKGISDPSLLYSAVVSAFGTAAKASSGLANTASEIAARNSNAANTTKKTNYAVNKPYSVAGGVKGGVDGTFSYTPQNLQTASGILDQGGTISGTTYNGRGSDGYVDPGAYVAVYQAWVGAGGTPKGFAAKFPVKTNVNPSSYSQLPTVLQPKTAAAPAAVPQ